MLEERRRTQRHGVSGRARMRSLAGTEVGDCRVADISEGGARIVAPGLQAPDAFLLVFEEIGGEGRECHVVWRLGDELGVEFLDLEEGFALRIAG
jgi:PilZ domain